MYSKVLKYGVRIYHFDGPECESLISSATLEQTFYFYVPNISTVRFRSCPKLLKHGYRQKHKDALINIRCG